MKRRTTSRNVIIAAAAILVAGTALHASGVLTPVTAPLVNAILGVAAPMHDAGVRVRGMFGGPGNGAADPEELQRAVDDLRLENAKLRNLLEENEQLKAAADYRERDDDVLITARVVSEAADPSFHGLVIDRGAADGVLVGAPVLSADGVLLGKVAAVRGQASSVRLLADSGSRLAVTLRNGAGTLGVLEGDRGLSMAISLIPQNEDVTTGDVVVTSGAEPGIRRGFPVGTIDKVSRTTQDPFQTATVSRFSSADRPVYVHVVITDTGL